jgi:hypothetical protein
MGNREASAQYGVWGVAILRRSDRYVNGLSPDYPLWECRQIWFTAGTKQLVSLPMTIANPGIRVHENVSERLSSWRYRLQRLNL